MNKGTAFLLLSTILLIFCNNAILAKEPTKLQTLSREHILEENEILYPRREKFDTYIQTTGPIVTKDLVAIPDAPPSPMPTSWNVPFDAHNWYTQAWHKDSNKPFAHGWYIAKYTIKDRTTLDNENIVLKINGVTHKAAVYVNKNKINEANISFVPYEVDITESLKVGENTIYIFIQSDLAKFASTPTKAPQPYGALWWKGMATGGLTYGAELLVYPKNYSKFDLTVDPKVEQKELKIHFPPFNDATKISKTSIRIKNAALSSKDDSYIIQHKLTNEELQQGYVTIKNVNLKTWEVNAANLYDACISFLDATAKRQYVFSKRFGYREFKIKDGKFFFNGKPFYLFGQNTTSTHWLPCNYKTWSDKKKQEEKMEKQIVDFLRSGYNMVRTAHEPIPEEYLTLADEYGLPIMSEWAWSFTCKIDEKPFSDNASQSLPLFVKYHGSHPSVISWCISNEVMMSGQWTAQSQMKRNYKILQNADVEKRPINFQSGGAGWFGADIPFETDMLDLHDYAGLCENWSYISRNIDVTLNNNESKYGKDSLNNKPFILMETVGYSWGIHNENQHKFIPNDRASYGEYISKEVSWGAPNVAGYIGGLPLETILDKNFVWNARNIIGKRIFETLRSDKRVSGFAPWFDSNGSNVLWTQPILPILRTQNNTFPNNIWRDELIQLKAFIHNTTSYSTKQSTLSLNNKTFKINGIKKYKLSEQPLLLNLNTLQDGKNTLKITLDEKFSNSYDINIFTKEKIFSPLSRKDKRPIYILNIGEANKLKEVLQRFILNSKLTSDYNSIPNGSLLIIPPNANENIAFNGNNTEFLDFLENRNGAVLILEQTAVTTTLPYGLNIQLFPTTFVDITDRTHPILSKFERSVFDTWNSPDMGYVAKSYIAPYKSMNTLLAKGPMLSSPTKYGSTLVEGSVGKNGYLLISTLDVLANIDDDPGAAAYLRELLSVAIKKTHSHTIFPLKNEENIFRGDINDLKSILLDSVVNANTKTWTDQKSNNLSSLSSGTKTFGGIVFTLPQSDSPNHAGIIRLRGHERPNYPLSTKINIKKKFKNLYFLHTSAWCFKGIVGGYKITYTNGKTETIKLEANNHIADWRGARPPQSAKKVCIGFGDDKINSDAFIFTWQNPYPNEEIATIDILSAEALRNGQNAWEATFDPVFIVLSITGEI